jgi:hypothetical protein
MKIVEETRQMLNEKFGDIKFIDEGHQYFINEKEYTPVSHIIKKYEQPFDEDFKSRNYAEKVGLTQEEVLRNWRLTNRKSTISGSRTHEFGESYTNVMCGHPELICDANKKQWDEEYQVLLPTYPKEEAIVKFYNEMNFDPSKRLYVVGAEFKLSTKYMENVLPICGTADILFYEEDQIFPEDSGFVIGDWKTNKELEKEYTVRNDIRMKYPMGDFKDTALSHYTLQFNLYQKMFESVGLKIIDRRLIWLKDDGSYEVRYIPKLDDKIMNTILKG